MQEQIFLQENGVTVSQVRFVTPSQTFAMQGVTSVAHNVFRPSMTWWEKISMVFGAILALISLIFLLTGDVSMIIGLLVGAAFMVPGIRWFRALSKPDHQVVLNA